MKVLNAQLVNEKMKLIFAQDLGENISRQHVTANVGCANVVTENFITNKVAVHLDIFGAFVIKRIDRNIQRSLTITYNYIDIE